MRFAKSCKDRVIVQKGGPWAHIPNLLTCIQPPVTKMRLSISILASLAAIQSPGALGSNSVPCTSTSTSTAVETIMITASLASSSSQAPSLQPPIPSSLPPMPSMQTPPSSEIGAPSSQPPTSDVIGSILSVHHHQHEVEEPLVTSQSIPSMPPPMIVTVTKVVTSCPHATHFAYPQITQHSSMVGPLSSSSSSNSITPTLPTWQMTPIPVTTPPTTKYITTSILQFIPQTSFITTHILPTPQCVLVTPSSEATSVRTVSQMTSRWVTTVVPESQEDLWRRFGLGQNRASGAAWSSAWSTAWTRHYVVRAGQTYEVTDDAAAPTAV